MFRLQLRSYGWISHDMIFVVILTKKNRLIHPLLVLVLFHGNCLWELGNGRGGAAQEIKRDGRILGIIFVVIFFVLVSDTSLLQSDIGIICSYHMLGHWLIWATTSGYFMVSQWWSEAYRSYLWTGLGLFGGLCGRTHSIKGTLWRCMRQQLSINFSNTTG